MSGRRGPQNAVRDDREAAASPGAGDRKSPPARQRSSHATLIQDFSARPPRSGRVRPLDAIIVPAGRRAEKLKTVAELAASVDVQLIILASRDCRVVEASKLVASIPGGRAFIVGIPGDYRNDLLTFQTSDRSFADLKAARDSDLSLKRNLSLLLARLMRWEKIMFLDDDIFRCHAYRVGEDCLAAGQPPGDGPYLALIPGQFRSLSR